eukprot:1270606-Prorocentrum_lima.AAC.1
MKEVKQAHSSQHERETHTSCRKEAACSPWGHRGAARGTCGTGRPNAPARPRSCGRWAAGGTSCHSGCTAEKTCPPCPAS